MSRDYREPVIHYSHIVGTNVPVTASITSGITTLYKIVVNYASSSTTEVLKLVDQTTYSGSFTGSDSVAKIFIAPGAWVNPYTIDYSPLTFFNGLGIQVGSGSYDFTVIYG